MPCTSGPPTGPPLLSVTFTCAFLGHSRSRRLLPRRVCRKERRGTFSVHSTPSGTVRSAHSTRLAGRTVGPAVGRLERAAEGRGITGTGRLPGRDTEPRGSVGASRPWEHPERGLSPAVRAFYDMFL